MFLREPRQSANWPRRSTAAPPRGARALRRLRRGSSPSTWPASRSARSSDRGPPSSCSPKRRRRRSPARARSRPTSRGDRLEQREHQRGRRGQPSESRNNPARRVTSRRSSRYRTTSKTRAAARASIQIQPSRDPASNSRRPKNSKLMESPNPVQREPHHPARLPLHTNPTRQRGSPSTPTRRASEAPPSTPTRRASEAPPSTPTRRASEAAEVVHRSPHECARFPDESSLARLSVWETLLAGASG